MTIPAFVVVQFVVVTLKVSGMELRRPRVVPHLEVSRGGFLPWRTMGNTPVPTIQGFLYRHWPHDLRSPDCANCISNIEPLKFNIVYFQHWTPVQFVISCGAKLPTRSQDFQDLYFHNPGIPSETRVDTLVPFWTQEKELNTVEPLVPDRESTDLTSESIWAEHVKSNENCHSAYQWLLPERRRDPFEHEAIGSPRSAVPIYDVIKGESSSN
jgi:hypothetical protein